MTSPYKYLILTLTITLLLALTACGTDPVKLGNTPCVKADGSVGVLYAGGVCK